MYAQPANDECVNAIAVSVSTYGTCDNAESGTTAGATQSSETLLCASDNEDVWYSFTPTQSGTYAYVLNNTSVNGYVHMYSGH